MVEDGLIKKLTKVVSQIDDEIKHLNSSMDRLYISEETFKELKLERDTYIKAQKFIYDEFPELKKK